MAIKYVPYFPNTLEGQAILETTLYAQSECSVIETTTR